MLNVGEYNQLFFEKFVEFGAYLSDGRDRRDTVLLPRKYVPKDAKIGDEARIFLYLDSEDRIVGTTLTPKAKVGDLAYLKVREQTKIGAFLDWGLEKDLFVPFREQPERMEVGKFYLVRLYLDKVNGRIVASRRLSRFYNKDVRELQNNQKVKLIVWGKNSVGYRVIVDEKYTGVVYLNECCRHLSIADRLDGFVHAVRPEENRVDVRLRQDGIGGVVAQKETILDAIRDANGFLPLNSNSAPEAIQDYFTMSKRTFKQAVGMLYKERKILIADDGIRLNPDSE